MSEIKRDFKGVWIPRTVWLDGRLNMLEKGILTEIDSLDMSESGCFASNQFLADFCQCSETKVSTAISKLIELGYLYVKSFDGRQRILKSRLSNFERQTFQNCEAESQDLKHNNTYTKPSNKTDNSVRGGKRKRFTPPTVDEVKAYCQERQNGVDAQKFVDYYTSNGWLVGKNKMRDWKAAVRTWERNEYGSKGKTESKSSFDADEFFNAALEKTYGAKKGGISARSALERGAAARMEDNAEKTAKTAANDAETARRAAALKEKLAN